MARVFNRFGADCCAQYAIGGILGCCCSTYLRARHPEHHGRIAEETRESFTGLERESGCEFRFVLAGRSLLPPCR